MAYDQMTADLLREAEHWKTMWEKTHTDASKFKVERDEALRMAGLLYNALLANHEAWETTNASNGAIRVARRATEDGIKYFERERDDG